MMAIAPNMSRPEYELTLVKGRRNFQERVNPGTGLIRNRHKAMGQAHFLQHAESPDRMRARFMDKELSRRIDPGIFPDN